MITLKTILMICATMQQPNLECKDYFVECIDSKPEKQLAYAPKQALSICILEKPEVK